MPDCGILEVSLSVECRKISETVISIVIYLLCDSTKNVGDVRQLFEPAWMHIYLMHQLEHKNDSFVNA